MSVWDWVSAYARQAYQTGDVQRIRLYELYAGFTELQDRDPEQALSLLEQARQHAELLGESWWTRFLDHWRLQILICNIRDYRRALDLAVQSAVETRKPIYAQFPQRVCLHEDLIMAYLGIDPEGYAPLIEQALQYMEQELAPGIECRHCVSELRTEFEVRMNHAERAEECALRALQGARADQDQLHEAIAFTMLCTLAHRRGDARALGEYAVEGVRAGFVSQHTPSLLAALMWQAVAARRTGNEREASRSYRTAIARANQTAIVMTEEFFDAASAFHEAAGDHEAALMMRRRELNEITGRGQIARECRTRLQICALLKLSGAPAEQVEAELRGAEETARRLKQPETALNQAAVIRGAAGV